MVFSHGWTLRATTGQTVTAEAGTYALVGRERDLGMTTRRVARWTARPERAPSVPERFCPWSRQQRVDDPDHHEKGSRVFLLGTRTGDGPPAVEEE
jgi:hypothetical protein